MFKTLQINILEKPYWARYKGTGRMVDKVSVGAGKAPRKTKEFLGSREACANKSAKFEHHLWLSMPEVVNICFSPRVSCCPMETGHQSSWTFLPWTCVELCPVEQDIAHRIWKSGDWAWILALSPTSYVSWRRALKFCALVPSSTKQGGLSCSQRTLPTFYSSTQASADTKC